LKGKTRIYELAKNLKKTNKEILAALETIGITGKTHSSSIEDDDVKKIKSALVKPSGITKGKAPAKPDKKKTGKKPTRAEAAQPVKKKALAKPDKKKTEKKPTRAEAAQPVKKKAAKPRKEALKTVTKAEEPVAEAISQEPKVDETVPRFDTERTEPPKVAPGMKKAFQAIRKFDTAKRHGAVGFKRRHRDRSQPKVEKSAAVVTAPRKKSLKIQEGITVKEFSEIIGIKIPEAIKKFMELGYMPTINQPLDIDAAVLVADSLGVKLGIETIDDTSLIESEDQEDIENLRERAPIVTIMGHVDHGKTSLLDAIRETKVIDTEAGGITQHIGAYKITVNNKDIVFLDTPGHEAFTALRARGAKVTDVVILIVAADDGVKPQTIEAIDHAKAANVPIIVAINKIDKPEANSQKVKSDLSELDIVPEEWGGKNIFAEISAKKRIGIESLLELILLQAEVMELKGNPKRAAKGVIIESRLDKGRGPVATVIIQTGTLRIGEAFLSGTNFGKLRALTDDTGNKISEAGPSTPVEIVGFGNVPTAGDSFAVVDDEKKARQVTIARLNKQKTATVIRKHKLTLDELYAKIKEGDIKDLNIIIKGDVQGSVEALKEALEGITHEEVQIKVIHSAAGGINESDVMLASASNAIIIGFNVRPELKATQIAEREGVDIEIYNVIYEAIDDVKKALEGMLEPTVKEKVLGRAEVRQTFQASKVGTIAGCMVVDGTVNRNCDGVRVLRDNVIVYSGKLSSLKRFKEDTKEVQSGYECGITIENFNDIKVGDFIENFVLEKTATRL
jgi:translation initiation factor IF-2